MIIRLIKEDYYRADLEKMQSYNKKIKKNKDVVKFVTHRKTGHFRAK